MESDMSILNGLSTAKLALSAQQYAMSITQRNTVNVNNPYFTRQDVFFTDPTATTNWSVHGIPGVEVFANRNRYLDQSISRELSGLGENLVKHNALREIDAILQATGGGGLGTSIADFFNSFTALSSNPTDSALRWQVLSTAQTMVDDFQRIYNDIQRVQNTSELQIRRGLDEVNRLTAEIASLNERLEIAIAQGKKETEFALRDERQQYIEELQGRMDFLYFETNTGSITITTKQGDAVVLADRSYNLSYNSPTDINLNGVNIIPANIASDGKAGGYISGEIGGHLDVIRMAQNYLNTLDDMARGIADAVNGIHTHTATNDAYDLDGNPGLAFFSYVSGVADLKVEITDPRQVAAADTPQPGNNENAKLLAALANTPISGGQTANQMYAALVYQIGSDQRDARNAGEKQTVVLSQLLGQRNAASSVSLNDEAVNLLRFQQAYQASARFVTVLNSLSAEILNFVR